MNPPKMPIHIGDLLRDTGHLRAFGIGAYLLLMFHYWSTGGLPDNDEQLAAIARMTRGEWTKHKPTLQAFFKDGWKHGRIDYELDKARNISDAAREAGKASGRSRSVKPPLNDRSPIVEPTLEPLNHSKKDAAADAAGAEAPIDHRKRLFDEGLPKLAAMTGKGPDACRSFVGKCLKAAGDDAITVLGLIDEAQRNQAVDPTSWIVARLKNNQPQQGNTNGRRTVHDAARDLHERVIALDEPPPERELFDGTGSSVVRLLPAR